MLFEVFGPECLHVATKQLEMRKTLFNQANTWQKEEQKKEKKKVLSVIQPYI